MVGEEIGSAVNQGGLWREDLQAGYYLPISGYGQGRAKIEEGSAMREPGDSIPGFRRPHHQLARHCPTASV
jgi:hypothetical protein